MVNKRWAAGFAAAAAFGVSAFFPALSIHAATDPKDVLRTAVDSTRQVSSIHAEGHTTGSVPAPSGTDVHWTASLAGSDSDITIKNANAASRTVAVGTKVYQQTPAGPSAAWRVMDRAPVVDDTTPGTGLLALTFPDGRSAGDPSLFRAVTTTGSAPTAAVSLPLVGGVLVGATASAQTTNPPQQTLVAELDMVQVGQALRIGPGDQSLLGQWQGSLTVTIGGDGRIARQILGLHGPSPTPGEPPFNMTHDVTYSQFNATTVAAPVQP